MRRIDVFNGDADGLCALRQLRLAEPAASELVTGVKRDIALLERAEVGRAGPGDLVSLVGSREAALALSPSFVPVDAAIVGIVDSVST